METTTNPTEAERVAIMRVFKRAFARADAELLAEVVAPDFAWHMHWYATAAPEPTGNVVTGVDAVMAEIAWRSANWHEVRFDGVVERYVDDLVVQTFRISGTDHTGRRFDLDAVDLYRFDEDRLALKDTYWKQPARNSEDTARIPSEHSTAP